MGKLRAEEWCETVLALKYIPVPCYCFTTSFFFTILSKALCGVATKCRGDSMGRMISEHTSPNIYLTFLSNYELVDRCNSVKHLMGHSFKTLSVGDLHLTFTVQLNRYYYIKGVVIYHNIISWKAWQYKLVPLQGTKKIQTPTEIFSLFIKAMWFFVKEKFTHNISWLPNFPSRKTADTRHDH